MIIYRKKEIEISPCVFMTYETIQLFWLFRFTFQFNFYENDEGKIIQLRTSDVKNIRYWSQIPLLDRYGWLIGIFLIVGVYFGMRLY